MWIFKILMGNLTLVFLVELLLGVVMGARNFRKIATVILVNIITNPFVVLSRMCLTLFFGKWQYIGICVLELIAFWVEGFAYSKYQTFGTKKSYIVSLVLNLTSFITGEIINIFI